MKKPLPILAALLAVLLLPSARARAEETPAPVSYAPPAHAQAEQSPVRLTVGTAEGEIDSEVDVPVSLLDCVGVDSVQFDLNYDPEALSVVSIAPGDLFMPEYCVSNADEPGRIRVACASRTGLAGDGTILTVRFRIIGETGSALLVTTPKTGEHAEKVISYVDEFYAQHFAYLLLENGFVRAGASDVPEALVTPWIPATPTPTPSPTPAPSPTPEATPEPDPAAGIFGPVQPISYVVVGALALALIALIAFSARNRRIAAQKTRRTRERGEQRDDSGR